MSDDAWREPSRDGASVDPTAGGPTDLHIRLSIVLLLAGVVGLGSMAAITGFGGVMLSVLPVPRSPGDPEPWQMGLVGIGESLMFMALLLPYGAAAVGVYRRRRWAQYLAAGCFALWSLGCCAPFGIYGVWALMRADGQRYFGG